MRDPEEAGPVESSPVPAASPGPRPRRSRPPERTVPPGEVIRIVLTVVAVLIGLYLVYRLRQPIGWILAAAFLAVSLSGPVNWLNRRMKRGFAITIVFIGLLLIPVLILLAIVPPIVTQLDLLIERAPQYARDVQQFVQENETLRGLEEDYDITGKLEEEAAKLPGRLGGAAGALSDIGLGLVNSVFTLVTILILTAFMLSSGGAWLRRGVDYAPGHRRQRIHHALDEVRSAISGYVGGAIAQAILAGVLAYIVLLILDVPFRAPLAFLVTLTDLIPLVGATIGAVIVGIVTVFTGFPTATIVWAIYSVIYQQVENSVIQPQIQKRAVNLHPFVVLVAVLFGATLLGVLGALIAIPVAAGLQIALNTWRAMRAEDRDGLTAPAVAE